MNRPDVDPSYEIKTECSKCHKAAPICCGDFQFDGSDNLTPHGVCLDCCSKHGKPEYDGTYVENHCGECGEFESECLCN